MPSFHACTRSHGLCVTGRQPTIYLVNDGRIAGPGFAQVEYDIPVPEPASVLLLGFQFVSVALFALCAARFGRNNDIGSSKPSRRRLLRIEDCAQRGELVSAKRGYAQRLEGHCLRQDRAAIARPWPGPNDQEAPGPSLCRGVAFQAAMPRLGRSDPRPRISASVMLSQACLRVGGSPSAHFRARWPGSEPQGAHAAPLSAFATVSGE